MKRSFTLAGLAIMMITGLFSCNEGNKNVAANHTDISNDSLVKMGEYLVNLGGCNDCHSPKNMGPNGPELDQSKLLSGYPASRPLPAIDTNVLKKGFILFIPDLTASGGPWGVSFAANLTSDPETGIGRWTEEQFTRALTEGKYNGDPKGRIILPPMPWQQLSRLKNQDIKAIYAYLKSTKPVSNKVPSPIAFNDTKSK